jgi:hypothetical protein
MDIKFDFSKFVEFLDREASQKVKTERVSNLTDNRRRIEQSSDYRSKLRWNVPNE